MSEKEPLILLVETATELCSVALSYGGEILGEEISREPRSHASLISVMTIKLMEKTGYTIPMCDAVAVSHGPGSYTGLRVGVSFAKGICYAVSKPLIAIGTLDIIAAMTAGTYALDNSSYIVPMIDARRMEVYTATYDSKGKRIKDVEALVVKEDSFDRLLESGELFFCGDGSIKVKPIIRHPNARFVEAEPLASNMSRIATQIYKTKKFEDLAYFEPFYLKEFIAGKPTTS